MTIGLAALALEVVNLVVATLAAVLASRINDLS